MRNRTFGIEFELRDNVEAETLVGALVSTGTSWDVINRVDSDDFDDGYTKSDGTAWEVKLDCSCGLEVCTPALTMARWSEVRKALAALYAAGARTNRNCSAHVHVDVSDFTVPSLQRLARLWQILEPEIFDMLAPSRRSNGFCIRLGRGDSITRRVNEEEFQRRVQSSGRYLALNMTGWWYHGRVEFRAHHGTLRSKDIRAWVEFLFVLVEAAKTMTEQEVEQLGNLAKPLVPLVNSLGKGKLTRKLLELTARRSPQLISA